MKKHQKITSPLGYQLWDQLKGQLLLRLRGLFEDKREDHLWYSLQDQLQLQDRLWLQLWDKLEDQLGRKL